MRDAHLSLSSHLLKKQDSSQSLISKFRMHTEEVSFNQLHCLAIDNEFLGVSCRQGHDLAVFGAPNGEMEFLFEVQSLNSPSEFLKGVSDLEVAIEVLNVVLLEEIANLPYFIIIFYIKIFPFESLRQRKRFLGNVSWLDVSNFSLLVQPISVEHYGFVFPHFMNLKNLDNGLEPFLVPEVQVLLLRFLFEDLNHFLLLEVWCFPIDVKFLQSIQQSEPGIERLRVGLFHFQLFHFGLNRLGLWMWIGVF